MQIVLFMFIFMTTVSWSTAASMPYFCVTCDTSKCEPIEPCTTEKLLDQCKCCTVCAKGLNDQCGGIWNHAGTCMKGLKCQPNASYYQLSGRCVVGSTEEPIPTEP
ncbi:single insulin-like growth factor-binding domain protein-2 [Tachypleus tridentatus]|uniref:single insulin-like growth factor-binding domain protein-2 n=1 Tax=Tachypleus tridentatus TaxID=6853 RepID=UPI003FD6B62C